MAAAVTDAYATAAEYRSVVGKSDSADDAVILRHLKTISRFFENQTHQFFTKDAVAVARIFYGNGSPILKVWGGDNCPGIADSTGMTVEFDSGYNGTYQTTFAAGSYELHPLNAGKGPEPSPYKELFLPYWTTAPYRFWLNGFRVRVTAIFGWPSIPEEVWAATIELCGIWRSENPRATGRMNELDQVVATSPMAMSLVKRLTNSFYEPVFA